MFTALFFDGRPVVGWQEMRRGDLLKNGMILEATIWDFDGHIHRQLGSENGEQVDRTQPPWAWGKADRTGPSIEPGTIRLHGHETTIEYFPEVETEVEAERAGKYVFRYPSGPLACEASIARGNCTGFTTWKPDGTVDYNATDGGVGNGEPTRPIEETGAFSSRSGDHGWRSRPRAGHRACSARSP